MKNRNIHRFHIPVLGTGFSIDAPLKVARYGISSVISLVDDSLMEKLRKHYSKKYNEPFDPIDGREVDSRARRITSYLNFVCRTVNKEFEILKESDFLPGSGISKYFEMLPDGSELKVKYTEMSHCGNEGKRQKLQKWLRENIRPGSIDVNIMTKLDKINYSAGGEQLPNEFNDAHAALRGFSLSDLEGSIVFSAGMNPRLYGYMEKFNDFFPDKEGNLKKKIVIKVSDFRSALIQGKFLAKKGLWVSEFRIESGLNCGGHAFATDGYLIGPILDEFRKRKDELHETLLEIYTESLKNKGIQFGSADPEIDLTAQGGVGSSTEQDFLIRRYGIKSVGWGSLFLLVPEVMNIDNHTLQMLAEAGEDDLYLSNVSPLGVPFNNLRGSSKEIEKLERIKRGKPGSPCPKKFLVSNKEFSEKPLCTASITYLNKKISSLKEGIKNVVDFERELNEAVEKVCLCEGLSASALTVNDLEEEKFSKNVSVCPGPNLAYYSKISTLKETVDHIYGRINLITDHSRPNMFIKELSLYIDYLSVKIEESLRPLSIKTEAYFESFRHNLIQGISYYRNLIPEIIEETESVRNKIAEELNKLEDKLVSLSIGSLPKVKLTG